MKHIHEFHICIIHEMNVEDTHQMKKDLASRIHREDVAIPPARYLIYDGGAIFVISHRWCEINIFGRHAPVVIIPQDFDIIPVFGKPIRDQIRIPARRTFDGIGIYRIRSSIPTGTFCVFTCVTIIHIAPPHIDVGPIPTIQ